MVKRATSVLAAALLSSCAVLPRYSETTSVDIKSVADQVQCEVQQGAAAIASDVQNIGKWGAAYSLDLKIDNKNNIALAAFDWTIPTSVATSTLSLAPTAKREATATRQGKLSFAMDVDKLTCAPPRAASGESLFYGNLGIADWLGRAAASNTLDPKKVTEINYSVTFAVVMGADLKPGFKIINLSAAGTTGASQTRTNTLNLALKPPPPPKPAEKKPQAATRGGAKAAEDALKTFDLEIFGIRGE